MNIRTLTKKLKAKYTFVGGEQHGYIKVGKNGLYGFVDCNGKVVIPLSYEWCTAFMRIRLYGKTYIGAYVEWDNSKAIIDKNNCFIVEPMERNAVSYVINEKLWVQDCEGFCIVNRAGRKMLSISYDLVINDRFRQPKGVFLVKKNGKFGAINVADNKRETTVLPLEFNDMNFWWSPGLGTLIETSREGKHKGLYKLDASNNIPERYNEFLYQTPFRKVFILAEEDSGYTLYCGETFKPIVSSDGYINSYYAFALDGTFYYSLNTPTQKFLVDGDNNVLLCADKEHYISCYHYLMSLQKDKFRFNSLGELVEYAQKIKNGNIKLTASVKRALVVYGQYFFEEKLHRYSKMYGYDCASVKLCEWSDEKFTKWGTCDYNNKIITLNIDLLFTSEEFIRMVILHEMVHLKYHTHNKAFYKALNKLCGYDERKVNYPSEFRLLTVDVAGIIRNELKRLFAQAKEQRLLCSQESKCKRRINKNITSQYNAEYEIAAMEVKCMVKKKSEK